MKYPALALLALCALPIHAKIYQCIVDDVPTFSQTPCAPDAKELHLKITKAPDTQGVSNDILQQCTELAKNSGGWRDPNSFMVVSHEKQWRNDASGARLVLAMQVNAKNGYGGYGDSKPFNCFLNHSGTGLSTVQRWVN
ncbi:hypothetical protein PH505_ba00260 [Pseudoalteromonas distincta]|uniref:hypothetical protein n=1 Tax=Pseudoalteromonas distincta TaxID=77608 RepID=UPI00020A0A39|nr:hypothetical protein [Pseudoalteromonas distincta]EGI72957.1 hypothetical protein PH505_ba00260 [Pseudoalteromonas distincta]